MKPGRIILVLVMFGAGLLLWWFLANFSLRPSAVSVGPSANARRDPYLAAGRLIEELGVPWQALASIASVPEDGVAVFLAGDRAGFVGRRQDALVNWVEQGGHLMVVVPQLDDDDDMFDSGAPVLDELLTRLGVSAYPIESSSVETITTGLPGDTPRQGDVEMDGVATLSSVEDPIYQIIDGSSSVVLLTVVVGFGRVTAMVDGEWVTNDKIGDNDHASLFAALVESTDPTGLWIVRGDQLPGFLALVARHGWPALSAFGVLVLLWLLRAGARFGPILPDTDPERRSLLEHLDAAGRFLWRCQAHGPMLRPMRDHLVREIGRRRPDWARLGDEQKILRLAELSDISKERVHHALLASDIGDAPGFVRAVDDLKKMESKL